jgi:hypothetical protein
MLPRPWTRPARITDSPRGSVRGGSARHRELLVFGGHERSRPVRRNRRSPHLPDHDLGEWCSETAGSNPTDPCRRPVALANEPGVAGAGLTLRSSWCLHSQAYDRRPRLPCHYHASHNGLERSQADTHGQSHARHDLRRSSSGQVTTPADLALQAGGRRFESGGPHHQLWLPS